jgi:hypothetical protein
MTRRASRRCPDDRGREAAYAAEEAAFGGTTLEESRPLAEIRERAASITGGDWWRRTGAPAVDVVAARSSARSSSARAPGRRAVVRIAAGQLDEATVSHELAHVLAGVEHGHDERFRTAHVDVVAMLAGSRSADRLTAAYRAFGLVIGPRAWPPPVRVEGDSFVIVP